MNVTAGDCEDFALTKRDHLIAMGWSPKALRIAVTKTPYGEGHAVLVVKTDQGDLVLDNRSNAIKGWKDTDLRWLMIQSGDNPRVWYELLLKSAVAEETGGICGFERSRSSLIENMDRVTHIASRLRLPEKSITFPRHKLQRPNPIARTTEVDLRIGGHAGEQSFGERCTKVA